MNPISILLYIQNGDTDRGVLETYNNFLNP